MKRYAALSVWVLSVLAAAPTSAAVQFAGTYSNLRYVEEAGDLVGEELTVIPQPGHDRYSVLVQCDDGQLGETVFIPATVKGDQITFDVPKASHCPGHFVGRLTTQRLKRGTETFLSFPGPISQSDEGAVRLKFTHSYWSEQ